MTNKKQRNLAISSVGLNCERCEAPMIPIVYGYPSGSMFRDAARGKIALGGCVIFGDDPKWTCSAGCDVKKSGEKLTRN